MWVTDPVCWREGRGKRGEREETERDGRGINGERGEREDTEREYWGERGVGGNGERIRRERGQR
jgi:hypothetical protein